MEDLLADWLHREAILKHRIKARAAKRAAEASLKRSAEALAEMRRLLDEFNAHYRALSDFNQGGNEKC
jgi:hypothetical protein